MLVLKDLIVDRLFSKEQASELELYVLASDSFVDYCVLTPDKRLLLLKSHSVQRNATTYYTLYDTVQEVVKADEILRFHFSRTILGIHAAKFTLVPAPLYDVQYQQSYLQQLTPIDVQQTLFTDNLTATHDFYNIYAADISVLDMQNIYFPQSRVRHHLSGLLHAHRYIAPATADKVIVNTRAQTQQIMVYQQQRLLFCNHFVFHSTNDFIYNILLVYDRFGLSTEYTPLYLTGQLDTRTEIYKLLIYYIAQVQSLPRNYVAAYLTNADFLQAYPVEYYYDLLTLHLCAS